jgi:hypothetical protein
LLYLLVGKSALTHRTAMPPTQGDLSGLRYFRNRASLAETARVSIAIDIAMGIAATIALVCLLIDWRMKKGVKVRTTIRDHDRTTKEAGTRKAKDYRGLEDIVTGEPRSVYQKELKIDKKSWTIPWDKEGAWTAELHVSRARENRAFLHLGHKNDLRTHTLAPNEGMAGGLSVQPSYHKQIRSACPIESKHVAQNSKQGVVETNLV